MSTKKTIKEGREAGRSSFPFVLGAALGLIVASLLLFIVVLHLQWVQKQVVTEMIHRIEKAAQVRIEMESYSLQPFSSLRLLHLKVTSSSGKDVLRSDEAQLAYRLSWKWPYIRPRELFLEKPVLHLEKDAEGRWQLPEGRRQEGTEKAPPVDHARWLNFPWPDVRISSGEIVALQNGHTILSLKNVTGTLSLRVVHGRDGPKLKIQLGEWHGQALTPRWGNWKMHGEVALGSEILHLDQLAVSTAGQSHISVEGTWALSVPHEGEAKIRLSPLYLSDFPELHRLYPLLQEISGQLHIINRDGAWFVTHALDTPRGNVGGTMQTKLQQGERVVQWSTSFESIRVPTSSWVPESDLHGHLELSLRGIGIDDVEGQLEGRLDSSQWGNQTIHGSAITGIYHGGTLEIRTSDVRSSLGNFSFWALADLKGLRDTEHQGEIKAELQVQRGNLEAVFSHTLPQVAGTARMEGRYGPGDLQDWKRWQAELDADLEMPEVMSLKISGAYEEERLGVDYDLKVDDLSKTGELFSPTREGKGRVSSRGTLEGKWPALVWKGTVEAHELQYGRVQAQQASLEGEGAITERESQRKLSVTARDVVFDGNRIGLLRAELDLQGDNCLFHLKGERVENYGSVELSGKLVDVWSPRRTLIIDKGRVDRGRGAASAGGKAAVEDPRVVLHPIHAGRGEQKDQLSGS